jgi:hypothetical protein
VIDFDHFDEAAADVEPYGRSSPSEESHGVFGSWSQELRIQILGEGPGKLNLRGAPSRTAAKSEIRATRNPAW